MRIAILGAGISGNTCAWKLSRQHEVTLFEAGSYAGGHTNTIDVDAYGGQYTVDTGFMVFNHRTYPHFVDILSQLGMEGQDSDMSFSVRCERTGWEYQGSSLQGLFAQKRNLLRPAFYGMLRDIFRFNRLATRERNALSDSLSMGDYLRKRRFGSHFIDQYFVPMTAAIWSARPDDVLSMPARFLLQFFHNHGLLQIQDRPQWKTVPGGARRYVEAMLKPLSDRVRLNCPVTSVRRADDSVIIASRMGEELFDAVIFACHADTALRILADADAMESETLAYFPYQANEAIVHTDERLLPKRRAAWASWNYRVTNHASEPVSVTYDLNRLQRLGAPGPICVTLNDRGTIRPERVIARIAYDHPVFQAGALQMQQRQSILQGRRRTYFCGAYWGYGFHEDGVRSALSVCQALEVSDGSSQNKGSQTWSNTRTQMPSQTAAH